MLYRPLFPGKIIFSFLSTVIHYIFVWLLLCKYFPFLNYFTVLWSYNIRFFPYNCLANFCRFLKLHWNLFVKNNQNLRSIALSFPAKNILTLANIVINQLFPECYLSQKSISVLTESMCTATKDELLQIMESPRLWKNALGNNQFITILILAYVRNFGWESIRIRLCLNNCHHN